MTSYHFPACLKSGVSSHVPHNTLELRPLKAVCKVCNLYHYIQILINCQMKINEKFSECFIHQFVWENVTYIKCITYNRIHVYMQILWTYFYHKSGYWQNLILSFWTHIFVTLDLFHIFCGIPEKIPSYKCKGFFLVSFLMIYTWTIKFTWQLYKVNIGNSNSRGLQHNFVNEISWGANIN